MLVKSQLQKVLELEVIRMKLHQTINFQPNETRAIGMTRWIQDYVTYSSVNVIYDLILQSTARASAISACPQALVTSRRNFLISIQARIYQPLFGSVSLSTAPSRLLIYDIALGCHLRKKIFFYLQSSIATRREESFFFLLSRPLDCLFIPLVNSLGESKHWNSWSVASWFDLVDLCSTVSLRRNEILPILWPSIDVVKKQRERSKLVPVAFQTSHVAERRLSNNMFWNLLILVKTRAQNVRVSTHYNPGMEQSPL